MTEPQGVAPADTSQAGTALDDLAMADEDALQQRRRALRRLQISALVVLLLLGAGAGRTVFSRMANARMLETGAQEHARQYVRTLQPRRSTAGQALALPGTLQGHVQAPIAARASGYLKRWTKDIGSKVDKGELLAELETPEIDQQLTQAVAARAQAASGLTLARSTVERWEGLRKKDVVSQQDLDERRSTLAQAQANLAAAQANVERLRQLEGFKRIVAPFAGVITRRNVDVGDLIDAGGAAARPLFLLAQADPLRVYVSVPQAYAQLIQPGQAVTVTQAELRGKRFRGQVARTAASIDTATRTMQIEVALPNPDGVLLPGAYVQVALQLQASRALVVPTNTLMFRQEGTMLASVDTQGRISLHRVEVGRNYGEEIEILDGIADTDHVVLNPPDWLAEGQSVVVAPAAPASAPASLKDEAGKERL